MPDLAPDYVKRYSHSRTSLMLMRGMKTALEQMIRDESLEIDRSPDTVAAFGVSVPTFVPRRADFFRRAVLPATEANPGPHP